MSLDVQAMLGPGGALDGSGFRYEHRPAQLSLAKAVERALKEGTFLLAEAGTGVGKTLAYLVPSLLSGRRVVISTATKNLQEQIYFRDLPLLKKRLGLSFRAEYLKGRANYLCLHRMVEEPQNLVLFEREGDALGWSRLRAWAENTSTGDLSELDLPEGAFPRSKITSTSENCLGHACPQYSGCFITRARRRAEEADLLVVNHHLLFADLALRSEAEGEGILPAYDAVIFDEAHALEDVATTFLGLSASHAQVTALVEDAFAALPKEDGRSGLLQALGLKLQGESEAFFRSVSLALGQPKDARILAKGALSALAVERDRFIESLAAVAAYTASAEEPELVQLGARASAQSAAVSFVCAQTSDDHAYWFEPRGPHLWLKAAPVEVGEKLKEILYPNLRTAVFTSATLTAGGSFDFCAERLGLAGWESFRADSPFDFRSASALYLPTHLPEPNAPNFLEGAVEELLQLAELSQGRAFFLFTSLRSMEAAYLRLKDRLGYPCLLQGQRPKRALLESFVERPSVLFASHSFWEGVDIPGPALSLVVMDRIPFASPQEPLVSARIQRMEARGDEPFQRYQLPQAALRLRQGFGRLLRTQSDRGAVAVLDRRLTQRSYGRELLKALPPATRVSNFGDLQRWWNKNLLTARET